MSDCGHGSLAVYKPPIKNHSLRCTAALRECLIITRLPCTLYTATVGHKVTPLRIPRTKQITQFFADACQTGFCDAAVTRNQSGSVAMKNVIGTVS